MNREEDSSRARLARGLVALGIVATLLGLSTDGKTMSEQEAAPAALAAE